MAKNLSPDTVKEEHIEKLGEELGMMYHALWYELASLYLLWNEYVELFGTKKSRLELLNKSAANFFHVAQSSLWESILMHLARLTDPPKSCGKENLSIKQLIVLVEKDIKQELEKQIDDAVDKADFCREWRNKHFAHRDLAIALGKTVEPLKTANKEKVEKLLKSLSRVLNIISQHYMEAYVDYSMTIYTHGAEHLLYVLDDGLRAQERRMERRRKNERMPQDLIVRDL